MYHILIKRRIIRLSNDISNIEMGKIILLKINLEFFLKFLAIDISLKVRLRWFGADLQCICKHVVFLPSFNISIGIIYH